MKLDRIDRKILDILQSNSNITNTQLAADIGISPPAMLDRVKRLENTGIIRKYVALVNQEKLNKGVMVLVTISLTEHEKQAVDVFKQKIDNLPEVLECYHIAGDYDFMLKVIVANIREYEIFVLEKLSNVGGISKIKSSFVLSTVKFSTKVQTQTEEK
jgi:Lrp/AsnC family leucine-responsive transcriptional regulator